MNRLRPLSKPRQVVGLLGWVLLSFAAAAAGGAAQAGSGAFFMELTRPSWAPPSWVFGPVWTVLYTLMGLSAWLVWRVRGFAGARGALVVFVVQLVANGLWTWLFFAWRQGALAFADIVLLWLLIVATMVLFGRVSKVAAALLVPYLLWVSFASALSFTIWQLNPDLLG
ncbi:MAG: TspO/MBR family protein [Bacteroidota bacterium]